MVKIFNIVCIALALCFTMPGFSFAQKKDKASQSGQTPEERAYASLFYEACREKTLGNVEAAASLFSKCISINPNNPAANYELASLYYLQNRIPESAMYAEVAYKKGDGQIWYTRLHASCLQRKGKNKEASAVLKKAVKQHPSNTELYYEYASSLLMSGKYKAAIKVYNQIEKQTGLSEEISLQKQKIYLSLGKMDNAVKELERLIEQFPNEARYYGLLADMYSANGMNEKAFDVLNRILKVDPDNGYVHLSLAEYYRSLGNKEKSFSEIKQAFGNNQVDVDTKMRILLSYYDLTERDNTLKQQAFDLLEILKNTHPEEARAHSIYGDFLYREKRVKEARDEYKKAVEFDTDKFVIWNQVLLLDGELQDFEDMAISSDKAKELFPNQPPVLLFNGIAYMQKKDYTKAIQSFKEGAALVIDNDALLTQMYAYLGDCYHAVNNYNESDASYEKALKADSNNVYVLNNYSYYLSVRNQNLDKAERMSYKTLRLQPNIANYEDTYAWILYQQKKYSEAAEWLERAVKNGGASNATILEHLGDAYFRMNKANEAVEYWNKANTINPSEKLNTKIKDKKLND